MKNRFDATLYDDEPSFISHGMIRELKSEKYRVYGGERMN